MSYRFIKRIPIIPKLVYLNITKHGISSLTVKIGWFSINFSKNGIKKTIGLHGTGLSFRKDIKYKNNASTKTSNKKISSTLKNCASKKYKEVPKK